MNLLKATILLVVIGAMANSRCVQMDSDCREFV